MPWSIARITERQPTLAGADLDRVSKHRTECPTECRWEIRARFRIMHGHEIEATGERPAPHVSSCDAVLSVVNGRVDQGRGGADPPRRGSPTGDGAERHPGWWGTHRPGFRPPRRRSQAPAGHPVRPPVIPRTSASALACFHSHVGARRAVLRSEGVAVERAADLRAGVLRDPPGEPLVDRALGEHGGDVLAPDRVLELRELARRGLGLRGLGGNHGADVAQPIAADEVGERVVVGDELALRRRDAIEAGADLRVEPREPAAIGLGARRDPRRRGGSCRAERLLDGRGGGAHVQGVVPPVRVRGPSLGARARELHRDVRTDVDDLGLRAGRTEDSGHPRVESQPAREDQSGARRGRDVLRARLVLVRVGVGLQQLVDVGVGAGDLPREVGELRRRGDDDRPPVRTRAAALPAGRDAHHHEGQNENDSHLHRAVTVSG